MDRSNRTQTILTAFVLFGAICGLFAQLSPRWGTVFGIATLAAVLAGFIWLIFTRSKFTIGQLLFSLFAYGSVLSVVSHSTLDRDRQIALSIASALAVLLFQFFGARLAARVDPRKRMEHWRFFIGGFFALPSGIGALVAIGGMLVNPIDTLKFLLALLLFGCCIANLLFVARASELRKFDADISGI